jgi:NADP-dependent 3-hydroxy acid dehydrogenase YdfG
MLRFGLVDAAWGKCNNLWAEVCTLIEPRTVSVLTVCTRLERLQETAKELSEKTGKECLPVQGDVRQPASVKEAVAKTIEKFGRIDYVICGMFTNLQAKL